MRVLFGLLATLTVALFAVVFWQEATPEWKEAQRSLWAREEARLEGALAEARRRLELPEVQSRLKRIEQAIEEGRASGGAERGARLEAILAERRGLDWELDRVAAPSRCEAA